MRGFFNFYNRTIDCIRPVKSIKEIAQILTRLNPIQRFNDAELTRIVPAERSAASFMANPNLAGAFHDVARKNALGKKQGPIDVRIEPRDFTPKSKEEALNKRALLASNGVIPETGNYNINFNPNVDEAIFAHELGHVASRQGKFGGLVRTLRDNRRLTDALALAGLGGGLDYTGLNEGNDDIDEAVAMSLVASAPTLLDEGLASMNALDIMNRAGSRASLGQRGKLAGGYLSYLAPALMMGLGSAGIGNMFD